MGQIEKEIDQFGRDVTTAPSTNPPLILTEPGYLDVFQPSLLPPVSTEPQFTDELESALSEYESRLQNTRDGNAAIKNWRMGNYRAVAEIIQRNPNIGIRLDGRLTLMGSQAADYILNSNGFRDETNAFLGYSDSSTTSQAQTNNLVELSGEARQQWESSVARLLTLLNDPNSQCYKFLKKRFSREAVQTIARDLRTQVPYDGLKSTNVDKGLSPIGDMTPKGTFEEAKRLNIKIDAMTANLHGNIYYGNVRGGIRVSLILHENIHRNVPNTKGGGISDDSLGRRIGAWRKEGSQDTSKINDTLEANGCK